VHGGRAARARVPGHQRDRWDALRGGCDRYGMIWCLQKFAMGGEIPFEAKRRDAAKVALELLQALLVAKSKPPEEQLKAIQYVQAQSDLAGLANKSDLAHDEL